MVMLSKLLVKRLKWLHHLNVTTRLKRHSRIWLLLLYMLDYKEEDIDLRVMIKTKSL